jgi:hypothetical protein
VWCGEEVVVVLCARESFCRTEATRAERSGEHGLQKEERLAAWRVWDEMGWDEARRRRATHRCHHPALHALLPCSARPLCRTPPPPPPPIPLPRVRVRVPHLYTVSCPVSTAASPDLLRSGTDTEGPHRPGFASLTPRLTSCPIHRILSARSANRVDQSAPCAPRSLASLLAATLPPSTCSAATHAAAVVVVAALNHLMHRTYRIATLARSPTGSWTR